MELGAVAAPPARARRVRRLRRALAALLLLAGGAAVIAGWPRLFGTADGGAAGRIVPQGTRITVEVLNATDARGLARQATLALRDAGFDVVYFGNTNERADTTIVRDRSGHADWAALAAKAMRGARVEQRPDSSHFLDLTILVGRNWTPPREPLRP